MKLIRFGSGSMGRVARLGDPLRLPTALGDLAPLVNAGGPYVGVVSTPIALNGTVTPRTYPVTGTLWTIVSGGAGTFGSATSIDTTFTPAVLGPYVLRLTATPSTGGPVSSDATLISGQAVVAPTVDAGGPYSGLVGSPIALNGTVTPGTDPSPAIVWTIFAGGTGTFADDTAIDTMFTPDDAPATYTLRLEADPNDGAPVVDMASLQSNPEGVGFFLITESASDYLILEDASGRLVNEAA